MKRKAETDAEDDNSRVKRSKSTDGQPPCALMVKFDAVSEQATAEIADIMSRGRVTEDYRNIARIVSRYLADFITQDIKRHIVPWREGINAYQAIVMYADGRSSACTACEGYWSRCHPSFIPCHHCPKDAVIDLWKCIICSIVFCDACAWYNLPNSRAQNTMCSSCERETDDAMVAELEVEEDFFEVWEASEASAHLDPLALDVPS